MFLAPHVVAEIVVPQPSADNNQAVRFKLDNTQAQRVL